MEAVFRGREGVKYDLREVTSQHHILFLPHIFSQIPHIFSQIHHIFSQIHHIISHIPHIFSQRVFDKVYFSKMYFFIYKNEIAYYEISCKSNNNQSNNDQSIDKKFQSKVGGEPILAGSDTISFHFKTRKSSGLLYFNGKS